MTVLAVVAVTTAVVDLLTKRAVTARLVEGRLYGAGAWGLRRVHNLRGAVIPLSSSQALAMLAVTGGAIVAAVAASPPDVAVAAGLGMLLGGAAGNVIGRVRTGAVVDFVAAGPWPVFNLADAAMVAGLLLALRGVA